MLDVFGVVLTIVRLSNLPGIGCFLHRRPRILSRDNWQRPRVRLRFRYGGVGVFFRGVGQVQQHRLVGDQLNLLLGVVIIVS